MDRVFCNKSTPVNCHWQPISCLALGHMICRPRHHCIVVSVGRHVTITGKLRQHKRLHQITLLLEFLLKLVIKWKQMWIFSGENPENCETKCTDSDSCESSTIYLEFHLHFDWRQALLLCSPSQARRCLHPPEKKGSQCSKYWLKAGVFGRDFHHGPWYKWHNWAILVQSRPIQIDYFTYFYFT